MLRSILSLLLLVAAAGTVFNAGAEVQVCLVDSQFILNTPADPMTVGILDTSTIAVHDYRYNAEGALQYIECTGTAGTPTIYRSFNTYSPDGKLAAKMNTFCWISQMGTRPFTNGTYTRYTYDSSGRVAFDSVFTDNSFGESVNYYHSYTYNATGDTAKIRFEYLYYSNMTWKTIQMITRVIKDDSLIVSDTRRNADETVFGGMDQFTYRDIGGKMVHDTDYSYFPATSTYPAACFRTIYYYDSLGNIISQYKTTHSGDYSQSLPAPTEGTVKIYSYGSLTPSNMTAIRSPHGTVAALSASPARLAGCQLLAMPGAGRVSAQVHDLSGRLIAAGVLPMKIIGSAGIYLATFSSTAGTFRQAYTIQ